MAYVPPSFDGATESFVPASEQPPPAPSLGSQALSALPRLGLSQGSGNDYAALDDSQAAEESAELRSARAKPRGGFRIAFREKTTTRRPRNVRTRPPGELDPERVAAVAAPRRRARNPCARSRGFARFARRGRAADRVEAGEKRRRRRSSVAAAPRRRPRTPCARSRGFARSSAPRPRPREKTSRGETPRTPRG